MLLNCVAFLQLQTVVLNNGEFFIFPPLTGTISARLVYVEANDLGVRPPVVVHMCFFLPGQVTEEKSSSEL